MHFAVVFRTAAIYTEIFSVCLPYGENQTGICIYSLLSSVHRKVPWSTLQSFGCGPPSLSRGGQAVVMLIMLIDTVMKRYRVRLVNGEHERRLLPRIVVDSLFLSHPVDTVLFMIAISSPPSPGSHPGPLPACLSKINPYLKRTSL